MDSDHSPHRLVTPWYYHAFFKYAVGILLVLSIILVFYEVTGFLTPILDFISTLFVPIVLSVLLYYLLRPIIDFFEKMKIPRLVSILFIYLVISILLVVFVAYLGPLLVQQIGALANTSVETFQKMKESSTSLLLQKFHINLDDEIEQRLFGFAQQFTTLLSKNLIDFLGILTRVTAVLAVIPFIVFYLLKDDKSFVAGLLNNVPEDFGRELNKILNNIDLTLSNYINGLVLVSSSVGILLFIGYLIIGLPYALVLSIIAIIFTTIPFLGPFLAITPALFVALGEDPGMVLKVVIVFVVAQQFESNIISPQVIGHRLHIHPLTIILLLLAAGSLYGLMGLILVTPLYAVSKVILGNLYKIYQLRYSHWTRKMAIPTEKTL